MKDQLLDAQGNPITTDKEVTTSLNLPKGIELSAMGLAMLDVLVTSQLLTTYGAQHVLKEAPGKMEEINQTVTEAIENVGEFTVDHLKQYLMMCLQIVCSHQAEMRAQAIVAEGIASFKAKLAADEPESKAMDGEGGIEPTNEGDAAES